MKVANYYINEDTAMLVMSHINGDDFLTTPQGLNGDNHPDEDQVLRKRDSLNGKTA